MVTFPSNYHVEKLEKVGILVFDYKNGYKDVHEVHLFCGEGIIGEPKESEEIKPQWFDVSDVPFDKMWPDDKFWFPLFLAGKKFKGKFLFDEADNVLEHSITLRL